MIGWEVCLQMMKVPLFGCRGDGEPPDATPDDEDKSKVETARYGYDN